MIDSSMTCVGFFGNTSMRVIGWPCQIRTMETHVNQGCIKIAFLESQWREIISKHPMSDSNVMKPNCALVLVPSTNTCLIKFNLQLQSTLGSEVAKPRRLTAWIWVPAVPYCFCDLGKVI